MKDLKGKVAIVTGAGGSGIGHNLAVELAKLGAKVAFCDIANRGVDFRGAGQRPFFSCLENQKGADLKRLYFYHKNLI